MLVHPKCLIVQHLSFGRALCVACTWAFVGDGPSKPSKKTNAVSLRWFPLGLSEKKKGFPHSIKLCHVRVQTILINLQQERCTLTPNNSWKIAVHDTLLTPKWCRSTKFRNYFFAAVLVMSETSNHVNFRETQSPQIQHGSTVRDFNLAQYICDPFHLLFHRWLYCMLPQEKNISA